MGTVTKSDLIWVVIRSSGFLLILRALVAVKDVASALYLLKYGVPPGSEFARMWAETMNQQFANATITGVFSLVVGLYLLRGGTWIHRLINYVSRERSNPTPHTGARDAAGDLDSTAARAGGRER